MLSASLSLVNTSDDVGSVFDGLLSVESTMFTSHSLYQNLGMLVDKNVWSSSIGIDTSFSHIKEALRLDRS